MRFTLQYLVVCLLLSYSVYGQNSNASKADAWYVKAQEAVKSRNFTQAERYFLKCLDLSPQNADAYYGLGMLYVDVKDYVKAAQIFQRAANSCPKCTQYFALPLAELLCKAGAYTQAEQVLTNWQKPILGNQQQKLFERTKQNIQFGKYAIAQKSKVQPQNLGDRINTKFHDYFPSISVDDSTLMFTRRTNGIDDDFYIAHRDSCGGWFVARDMGSPPNSALQDAAQMLSADGHYLFFSRCGMRTENGWDGGGCDLFFSYTEADEWSIAVPFGATINTPAFEGMPSLSSDNKSLYFVSDREGGYGGKDIWVSRFEDGLWQIPVNMGPTINTPFDETAPHIAADNQTLYFSSDGHPGLGGFDLFFSKKVNGIWQRPENLGIPINTGFDDISICLNPNGTKAYFASDRAGGIGAMDIYETELPLTAQPEPYTFVYGIVYDSLSAERLTYAQIEWVNPKTEEKIFRFQSNRGDASYMAAIPLNQPFQIRVFRTGYSDKTDTVLFTQSNIVNADTLNFAMLSYNYSPPLFDSMAFRFHYEKNVTIISDSAQQLLQQIALQYKSIEQAKFILDSYTDNKGAPVINEELSYARGRFIKQLLETYGIPEERIEVQGWADANPLVPNETDENRYLNRRVEVTIRKP